jgi:hypothetical protein
MRVILERMSYEEGAVCRLDSTGSVYGAVTVSCKHGTETPSPIKDEEFINQLSNCQLMEKDLLPVACYVVRTAKFSL